MFVNKPEFAEPIRVLFLCGVKFKDCDSDKRVVLKKYLEQDPKNKVLILEKYFDFVFKKDDSTGLLSYYDADLFNLHSIESLAALIATNVIIIHESLSTAGELGVFGSNKDLRNRIITLVPERYSVEEEKLSGFLRLAFWNHKERLINNHVIRFYPVVARTMISETHSFYETSFRENILPTNLARKLDNQLEKNPRSQVLAISEKNIRMEKQSIKIWMSCNSIKNYMLAILSVRENRQMLRACTKICDIHNFLTKAFNDALRNSYRSIKGKTPKTVLVYIENQPGLTFQNAVGFMSYFCHACNIMKITCNEDDTISVNFAKNTSPLWEEYSELINPVTYAEWGE